MLTPVVAWAFSFLGGWVGALAGRAVTSEYVAIVVLVLGAVAGAVVGGAGWVMLIRRLGSRAA